MNKLRKTNIENESIEIISSYVTKIIDEYKSNYKGKFLEGVFYY